VVARPGGDEVLSLEDCVALALEQNDQVQAERSRRQELDGQMIQALSTGLPTLDATGEWSRGRDPTFALDESFAGGGDEGGFGALLDSLFNFFDLPADGGSFLPAPEAIPAQTFWRASLDLHWTINPILVIGAVGAADLSIQRQDLAVVEVEHRITEETVIAYHGIILAAEDLAAVEAQITNQEELLEIMKLRHEVGMATELDTLQAAVSVANLRPQWRRARQNLRNAGARLNALMGRTPATPVAIHEEQHVENDPVDRQKALELALQRPDLRQVELFSSMLRRNRQVQKSDMRPYLTIDGSYGWVARQLDELDRKGHDFWRAAVALNVPLFNGLLTRGQVKETEASIRRTENELSGLRRQVEVEVLELGDNLTAAQENLAAARLNLKRSEDLLEQFTLMLRLGKTDYLSVLEAEANRAQARSNLIEARYEVLALTASLKRALGFSPMTPLAALPDLVSAGSP
jgi:outer membrane protein TolC